MQINKKNGFTLAEMLITLGIVAFLAMVLLPILKQLKPNEEMLKFRKAYYLTERIVSELVNDDAFYPETDDPDQKPYLGNTESVTYKGDTYSGDTKFCELFASKINKSSAVDCSSHSFSDRQSPTSYTFKTADGMVWILPITSFSSEEDSATIQVDVNGDKKDNCYAPIAVQVAPGTGSSTGIPVIQPGLGGIFRPNLMNICKNPDRFRIKIYQDGRVEAGGTKEQEYLNERDVTK